jgi:hypothetical protein
MSSHLQQSLPEDDVQKKEHQKIFNDLKAQIDLKRIMLNPHMSTLKRQLDVIEEESSNSG